MFATLPVGLLWQRRPLHARADLASGLPAMGGAGPPHRRRAGEEDLRGISWSGSMRGSSSWEGDAAGAGADVRGAGPRAHVRLRVPGRRECRALCCVGGAAGEELLIVIPAAEGDEARDVVITLPTEAAKVCCDVEVLHHGAQLVFGVKAGKVA